MARTNNFEGEIWTDDDDLRLAEMVLSSVRGGGSIMDACRAFEKETDGRRTASASKFRWHTRLKKSYQAAYETAKKDGEERKKVGYVNQGARYEHIVENVLNKEQDHDIELEDIFVLMKKFRDQENSKEKNTDVLEKENKKLNNKLRDKEKELKKMKDEFDYTKEVLLDRDRKYKELMDSLQVLKKAGIQINIPDQKDSSYIINKDGTVERV